MHVMSVEYLRPMMGASPSSDQLQQQLSQNTRGHCRPSTREGGKGGARRARPLSAAARGPHLSTRNPRPKESARPGGIGRVNFVIRQIVREVAQQRECHIAWPFIDLRHVASRNRLGYLWIRYLRRRSKFRRLRRVPVDQKLHVRKPYSPKPLFKALKTTRNQPKP